MRIETIMYDADGKEADDRTRAVRAELLERNGDGRVVRRYPDLSWQVDERALHGDAGEAATRPESAESEN
jgi:hypothetical protein